MAEHLIQGEELSQRNQILKKCFLEKSTKRKFKISRDIKPQTRSLELEELVRPSWALEEAVAMPHAMVIHQKELVLNR